MSDLRARSRTWLQDQGWLVETVEHFNYFTKRKSDMWGWADLFCLRGKERLAVQVTSRGHRADHIRKIEESESVSWVREAEIGIHLHLWWKADRKWHLTVVDLS